MIISEVVSQCGIDMVVKAKVFFFFYLKDTMHEGKKKKKHNSSRTALSVPLPL